jgi:hypothetical protein
MQTGDWTFQAAGDNLADEPRRGGEESERMTNARPVTDE